MKPFIPWSRMNPDLRRTIDGVRRWIRHDGPGLSAAVSFYAVFAMAPVLVFAVVVASKALGPERAKQSAIDWLSDVLPHETAESLVDLVHIQFLAGGAWWADLISGLALLWASSLMFMRVTKGTRILFGENGHAKRSHFRRSLIGRGIAILFAVGVGILICLVFIFSSFATPFVSDIPFVAKSLISIGNALILMTGAIVLLQSVTLPSIQKRALFATGGFLFFAFILGRFLFQSFISHSVVFSAYGVASSLVVILIWIYYMSAGYFIGVAVCAEFHENRELKETSDGSTSKT